jgi:phenylalanyl-tRNA synthetase alpha chain
MVSNITQGINSKIGRNLHNTKNHPIEIIKRRIYDYFGGHFKKFDDLSPIVPIEDNFDSLLIAKDHPARSQSDTYYKDENHVLRTQTSAHQTPLLKAGERQFLVTGDVYRKDDIDATHYPVFHQMEGLEVMGLNITKEEAETALKHKLSGLIEYLFPGQEYRFNPDYFPFTEPSYEVEVMFNGKWMEVLGCGVVQPKIMENCGLAGQQAWAFGLGLERLAMAFFKIPDIRYFWSTDERFSNQFTSGEIIEFKPYSDYPAITRDISFWIPADFAHNNFCEIVRETGGDLVESVTIKEEFTHPKTSRQSRLYQIVYRSNDRTLTSDEINDMQGTINSVAISKMQIEIRG